MTEEPVRNSHSSALKWRIALAAWTVLVAVASFLPQGTPSAAAFTMGGRDFPAHVAAYGVLTLLSVLSLRGLGGLWRMAIALVFAGFVSASTEAAQELAGRSFELSDLLADAIGVAAGLLVGLFVVLFLECSRSE